MTMRSYPGLARKAMRGSSIYGVMSYRSAPNNWADYDKAMSLLLRKDAEIARVRPDTRPCSTDEFLVKLFDKVDDHYDREEAIKAWLHGGWDEAMAYLEEEE